MRCLERRRGVEEEEWRRVPQLILVDCARLVDIVAYKRLATYRLNRWTSQRMDSAGASSAGSKQAASPCGFEPLSGYQDGLDEGGELNEINGAVTIRVELAHDLANLREGRVTAGGEVSE